MRTKRRDDVLAPKELNVQNKFSIGGTQVTATASELNALDGITADVNELNILEGVTATAAQLNRTAVSTAGTAEASKVAVLGSNKELDEFHTAALYLGAAAGTQVTATADELNELDGALAGATITVGAEDANVVTVTIQLEDATGAEIAEVMAVDCYISSDSVGCAVNTVNLNTGLAASTDGAVIELVADKLYKLISEADGDIDITVTHDDTASCYLNLIMPNGSIITSDELVWSGA